MLRDKFPIDSLFTLFMEVLELVGIKEGLVEGMVKLENAVVVRADECEILTTTVRELIELDS